MNTVLILDDDDGYDGLTRLKRWWVHAFFVSMSIFTGGGAGSIHGKRNKVRVRNSVSWLWECRYICSTGCINNIFRHPSFFLHVVFPFPLLRILFSQEGAAITGNKKQVTEKVSMCALRYLCRVCTTPSSWTFSWCVAVAVVATVNYVLSSFLSVRSFVLVRTLLFFTFSFQIKM